MKPADDQILLDAIARNASAVLSLPSQGMLRHMRTRFLAANDGEFWMEADPEQRPLIDALIESGQPAGVAFKSGINKVVFTTPLLRCEAEFAINAQTRLPAVMLRFPGEVKSVQRRSNYRVRVPDDWGLTLRLWRISPQAVPRDRPVASQEIQVELYDISTGGMGVILHGKNGNPAIVSHEDRLRVQIVTESQTALVIEGRLCYPDRLTAEVCHGGVQFKELERDLEGRHALAILSRICGELQRKEARQHWLGMSA